MVKRKVDKSIGILALVVNLFLPGIGSLIGGKIGSGVAQIILGIVGTFLCLTIIGMIIGVPMIIAAWIWALICGIQIVHEAD